MTDANKYYLDKREAKQEEYDFEDEYEEIVLDNMRLEARVEQLEAKLAKAQSALKRIARTKPHFAGGTPNEHFMRTWAKEALADSQN